MRTFLSEVALGVVDDDVGFWAFAFAEGVVVVEVSVVVGFFLFGQSLAE